ncbi:MAG: DUF2167 domain-containing protein [Gammaproteobacteria bacterium]|nr:DUF2167 domain-containing protein [Gammaproteobacteria bacterium]
MKLLSGLSIFIMLMMPCAYADTGTDTDAQEESITAAEFEASLNYQQGVINLPGGKATLQVPEGFRYIDSDDTQRVLEQAWGNPDGTGTLGMLFPAKLGPTDDNSWGVVITYQDDGHISDEDADSIDYADLLENMQAETAEDSKERVEAGYEPISLVGWAEMPSYDPVTKKMYWAKELMFGEEGESTLNYNVRVLGREGVLVLNAVAGTDQLPTVKESMQDVISFSNFTEGNRYADYDPDTDNVAAYGLAALVGGTMAAKTGLLAKLIALLVMGKKFIILFVIAIGVFLKKMLSRKKAE